MQRDETRRGMRMLARAAVVLVLPVLTLLPAACDPGSGPSDVIDRETFIETYIDLRRAALVSPDGEIDAASRDEVLQRHGVTEEDLLDFVEAHGRDVDYLRDLWTEVETRMDTLPAPPGAAEG